MIKSPEEINHHGAKVKAPQKMRVITEQSHLGLPSLIRIKVYLNSFIHKVSNNHIAWPATHLAKSPISDDALVCHWITRTLLLCIGSEHWGEWIGGVQDWWLLSDCSRVESWTLQLSTYRLSLSLPFWNNCLLSAAFLFLYVSCGREWGLLFCSYRLKVTPMTLRCQYRGAQKTGSGCGVYCVIRSCNVGSRGGTTFRAIRETGRLSLITDISVCHWHWTKTVEIINSRDNQHRNTEAIFSLRSKMCWFHAKHYFSLLVVPLQFTRLHQNHIIMLQSLYLAAYFGSVELWKDTSFWSPVDQQEMRPGFSFFFSPCRCRSFPALPAVMQ